MFAIGDKEWPGISKLVEEMGEVAQVCGKLIGSRGARQHFDGGPDLKVRLEEELADVVAAVSFVMKYCELNEDAVLDRAQAKANLFEEWHEGKKE